MAPRALAGGQVATCMLGLRRLGERVAYFGAVGDDPEGEAALATLQQAGVDCRRVQRIPGGRTRQARIQVDPHSGERRVEALRDPRVRPGLDALRTGALGDFEWLHLDAEDPDLSVEVARLGRSAGCRISLDLDRPGPLELELVSIADCAIVSESFCRLLSDGREEDCLRDLVARGAGAAILTRGARGALGLWSEDGIPIEAGAFEVGVCDTTGAGDAFRAGFLWAQRNGLQRAAALRAACAAGALNCRGLGAQAALPNRSELEELALRGAWREED